MHLKQTKTFAVTRVCIYIYIYTRIFGRATRALDSLSAFHRSPLFHWQSLLQHIDHTYKINIESIPHPSSGPPRHVQQLAACSTSKQGKTRFATCAKITTERPWKISNVTIELLALHPPHSLASASSKQTKTLADAFPKRLIFYKIWPKDLPKPRF